MTDTAELVIWTRDGNKSVYDLACEGAYKTKLPYPERISTPALLRKTVGALTAEELTNVAQVKADHDAAGAAYVIAKQAYHADDRRLTEQLRLDLEAETGMTGHPKADKLWGKAWEDGHSGGMTEVANTYNQLVDLVL